MNRQAVVLTLILLAHAGKTPMNKRRFARSSGSPRLPFICMTVYRTF